MPVSGLEQWISNSMETLIGNPTIIGIVFIAVFTAFVMLQGTRLDGKLAILIPVLILASVLIPFMWLLLGLFLGVLVYFALTKFTQR